MRDYSEDFHYSQITITTKVENECENSFVKKVLEIQ